MENFFTNNLYPAEFTYGGSNWHEIYSERLDETYNRVEWPWYITITEGDWHNLMWNMESWELKLNNYIEVDAQYGKTAWLTQFLQGQFHYARVGSVSKKGNGKVLYDPTKRVSGHNRWATDAATYEDYNWRHIAPYVYMVPYFPDVGSQSIEDENNNVMGGFSWAKAINPETMPSRHSLLCEIEPKFANRRRAEGTVDIFFNIEFTGQLRPVYNYTFPGDEYPTQISGTLDIDIHKFEDDESQFTNGPTTYYKKEASILGGTIPVWLECYKRGRWGGDEYLREHIDVNDFDLDFNFVNPPTFYTYS